MEWNRIAKHRVGQNRMNTIKHTCFNFELNVVQLNIYTMTSNKIVCDMKTIFLCNRIQRDYGILYIRYSTVPHDIKKKCSIKKYRSVEYD